MQHPSHDRHRAKLHPVCEDKDKAVRHDHDCILPACFVAATIGSQPADVSTSAYERASRLGWQVSCNYKQENLARQLSDAKGLARGLIFG
jgi:hypothetical protein